METIRMVCDLEVEIDLRDRERVERFVAEVLNSQALSLYWEIGKQVGVVGKVHVVGNDLRKQMLKACGVRKDREANL